MSDKHYHPDGFVPVQNASMEGFTQMPKGKMSDDIAALERGIAFFDALKVDKAFHPKELSPMSHDKAEEIMASHQGLTFAAIRAVERAHGIV